VANLLSGDDHNVAFLLRVNVIDNLITRAFMFNTTVQNFRIDIHIMLCFFNLINSAAFQFGLSLITGYHIWFFDSIQNMIFHNEARVRTEALMIISSLLK
jgi:hypothetical protein